MTDANTPEPTSSDALIFPNGIPGFENERRYRLTHSDTEAGRVYWLECLDDEAITFTLVDPASYGLNYVLELTPEEEQLLAVDNPEQIAVLLMLRKSDELEAGQATASGLHANIIGPILLNVDKRLGMQKVLTKTRMEVNIIEASSATG